MAMHPELIFLGTASDCVSIGRRSGAGLPLKTKKTRLHIDPGLFVGVRVGCDASQEIVPVRVGIFACDKFY